MAEGGFGGLGEEEEPRREKRNNESQDGSRSDAGVSRGGPRWAFCTAQLMMVSSTSILSWSTQQSHMLVTSVVGCEGVELVKAGAASSSGGGGGGMMLLFVSMGVAVEAQRDGTRTRTRSCPGALLWRSLSLGFR